MQICTVLLYEIYFFSDKFIGRFNCNAIHSIINWNWFVFYSTNQKFCIFLLRYFSVKL